MFNNADLNLLYDLKRSYRNQLEYYHRKHSTHSSVRLIAAIEIIEKANRTIIWRTIEYFYFVINYTYSQFLSNNETGIQNISIGVYQLKIEHISDYLRIGYRKVHKTLYLSRYSYRDLVLILKYCNEFYVIEYLLKSRFESNDFESLSDNELSKIALFYSRNKTFSGTINYYTVLKSLYNSN